MTRDEVIKFLRENKIVVEASLHRDGSPQAAAVGIAVTDDLHLVFDTVTTSRKHANLLRDPRCAFVAWHGGVTIQIEGQAELLYPTRPTDELAEQLAAAKAAYFSAFPDGPERESWPDIAYWRVRPTWIRASDYGTSPAAITVVDL
ncbi:MAG TPA: pyridoxamine 5'-phosphate oxidase family protein [Kofleriaceae bacterium]|jgi:pyridoxine/pyridoxamine 5'-phosphate oxidase